jgi:hydroxymethylbilane synthase
MSMKKTLKIATRKSPLALWQAEYVKSQLQLLHPDLDVELIKMTTKGDQILNSPLSKIGGKGLFIKELEVGMLEGRADIAVHSMKDVPYAIPDEFELGVVMARENPFDAFVSNNYNHLSELPQGARVGSCSMRRVVQIKAIRPDLEILDLRGNVNTRLRKLDDGEYDAIILACAGLIRLGFEDRIKHPMDADTSLPAVGQGALGIEIRKGDSEVTELIKGLVDQDSMTAVLAERAMNATLEGGCSVPIAGYATIDGEVLTLKGLVGNVNSGEMLTEECVGSVSEPEALGRLVANNLIAKGAKTLLSED